MCRPSSRSVSRRALPRWKRLLFALVPVATLLLVGEGLLRLSGWESDPWSDTLATRGLEENAWIWRRDRHLGSWYVQDAEDSDFVRSNPRMLARGFHDERFSVSPGGALRIFALGGSTTYGIPFEDREKGFPERMQRILAQRWPDRPWQVVNAGVAGMDSRSFPALVEEVLALGARGLVLYTGNNEVLGTLVHRCTRPWRDAALRSAHTLRLFQWGRASWRRLRGVTPLPEVERWRQNQRDCMLAEIEGWLRSGQKEPPVARHSHLPREAPWIPRLPARTDPIYAETVATFHRNLERVARLAARAHVPIWLALPPTRLRAAPAHPVIRPDLSREDRKALRTLLQEDPPLSEVVLPLSEDRLLRAHALDPTHAGVNHALGLRAFEAGRTAEARKYLQLAVDRDFLAQRITSHLGAVLEQVCEDHPGVTCVDVRRAFEAASPQGIPGEELFEDFCHPTFARGTQLVAETFAAAIHPGDLAGEEDRP